MADLQNVSNELQNLLEKDRELVKVQEKNEEMARKIRQLEQDREEIRDLIKMEAEEDQKFNEETQKSMNELRLRREEQDRAHLACLEEFMRQAMGLERNEAMKNEETDSAQKHAETELPETEESWKELYSSLVQKLQEKDDKVERMKEENEEIFKRIQKLEMEEEERQEGLREIELNHALEQIQRDMIAMKQEQEEKDSAHLAFVQQVMPQLESMQQDMAHINEEKEQYKLMVQEVKNLNAELLEQNAVLQASLKHFEEREVEAERLRHILQKDREDLDKEKCELEKEKESCMKMRDNMEKENERLEKDKSRLERDKDRLEKEKESLDTDKGNLKNEREILETRIEGMRNEQECFMKESEILKKEQEDLKEKKESVKNEMESLEKEKEELEKVKGCLNEERQHLENEKESLEKGREGLKEGKEKLDKENHYLQEEYLVLGDEWEKVKKEWENLNNDKANLKKTRETLDRDEEKWKEEKERFKKEVDSFEQEKEKYKKKRETWEKENAKWENKRELWEKEKDDLENERESLEKDKKIWMKESAYLKTYKASLKNGMESFRKCRAGLMNEKDGLMKEKAILRQEKETFEKEKETFERKKERFEEEKEKWEEDKEHMKKMTKWLKTYRVGLVTEQEILEKEKQSSKKEKETLQGSEKDSLETESLQALTFKSKRVMSGHNEVMVYVRTRPTTRFAQELIECLPDKQTVNIRQKKISRKGVLNNQVSSWSFRLNGVLHNVSQEDMYEQVADSVVLGALEGYNGTIMCFGQTGAGKTFTMTGATENYKQRGIIPRAIQKVFCEIGNRVEHTFSVHLSFLEIYNETLMDLLAVVKGGQAKQCETLTVVEEPEGGVSVKGLSLHSVHKEEEALNLLFEGEMNKIIGEHALNKNSSRSHCIFTLYIEARSRTLSNATFVTSKLNLVDLAGSERLSKTGSEGQVQKEALYINKSLSFLEQAILALADRRREHVPFRQSKLTHALKDSLGGNCNTVLVANIFAEESQINETLSTLRFAARMKCVCTQPTINKRIDPALQAQSLQKEIELLKQELSFQNTLANRTAITYEDVSEAQKAVIKSEVQRYLAGTLDEIPIASIRKIQAVFAQFKKAFRKHGQNSTGPEENLSMVQSQAEVFIPPNVESAKDDAQKRCDSPPSKQEAFELYKAEKGSEINSILKENKSVLKERLEQQKKLTAIINFFKRDIDRMSTELQLCKKQRQGQGQLISPDGEPVLDEAEVKLLLHLREAKDQYRKNYEELLSTKAEVQYCRHLVDQCRVRLFTEFESWYNESFLLPDEVLSILKDGGPIRPGLVPVDKALALVEDEQEESEPTRILADSATSFYNAYNRTIQRVIYKHTHTQKSRELY
ncbi:kinesin-like protein KIF9 [Silurus meridionalis]|nr:kinesin-like protein KIF9 [Silurus meridionalis]